MRDLLKRGELPERPLLGHRTADRLLDRQYRRPVGNSARTWSKFDVADPFEPPRRGQSTPRAVYASGRFVQIDKYEKKKPGGNDEASEHSRMVEELKRRKEAERKRALESAQAEAPAARPAPSPPSRKPPMPKPAPKAAADSGSEAGRGLPPVRKPPSGRVSSSGRIRARPTMRRSAPTPTTSDELDRRRPPRAPNPEPRYRKVESTKATLTPDDLSRRPPIVASGRNERLPGAEPEPEPDPTPAPAPRAEAPPAPAEPVEAAPPPVEKPEVPEEPIHRLPPMPKREKKEAPAAIPRPASSMSLDDIFAAPSEGRVRIRRNKKDDTKKDG